MRGTKTGITGALAALAGALAGAFGVMKKAEKSINRSQNTADKNLGLFLMMEQWVMVKQEGKNLASYFEAEGYQKIAVYGMNSVAGTLVRELQGSAVEIAYGIDRRTDAQCTGLDIVSPDHTLEAVDAVVVTAISFYDEIAENLSTKVNCPVISLEDLLYEV